MLWDPVELKPVKLLFFCLLNGIYVVQKQVLFYVSTADILAQQTLNVPLLCSKH